MSRPGNTLYAWQVFEDGDWGVIAGVVDDGQLMSLVSRSALVAQAMEPVARRHADSTGLPVRLARFTFDREEQRL